MLMESFSFDIWSSSYLRSGAAAKDDEPSSSGLGDRMDEPNAYSSISSPIDMAMDMGEPSKDGRSHDGACCNNVVVVVWGALVVGECMWYCCCWVSLVLLLVLFMLLLLLVVGVDSGCC